MSSCCPPNSEKFLLSSYQPRGSETSYGSASFYSFSEGAIEGKNAVIIIPDVFGWAGGRVRNIADQFADAGFYSVVPKLLPSFPKGEPTLGDGLPADFDWAEFAVFKSYLQKVNWEDSHRPIVKDIVAHFKISGVKKIVLIGFCWGGLVVSNILADAELSADVVCGVIPHPSITLEEAVYERDAVALVQKVTKPILLLPAGNDVDRYRPGGDIYEALVLAAPGSACEPTEFSEMKHGWAIRGDTEADPLVKEKATQALSLALDYFHKHL